MKYGSLLLEKKEYVYLKRILNISGYAEDFETQKSLARLSEELKTAKIIDEIEMPADVVRFNSCVTVSSDVERKKVVKIVIPMDENQDQGRISILKPLAAALFGYSESDVIEWDFPTGKRSLTIEKVKQDKTADKIEVPI
jgi:regulator of nucleoside diphosphate kinase